MKQRMHTAFIGLGSNLADPVAQVSQAMDALDHLAQTRVVRCSSLYRSAPVGYLAQPDFINAVVQLETGLAPRALLDALLALELEQGRTREFCNAPRTLDLDILLYDDLIHHRAWLDRPASADASARFCVAAFARDRTAQRDPGCRECCGRSRAMQGSATGTAGLTTGAVWQVTPAGVLRCRR